MRWRIGKILFFILFLVESIAFPAMAATPLSEQELIARILIEFPRYVRVADQNPAPPTLCLAGSEDLVGLVRELNKSKKTFISVSESLAVDRCDFIYFGNVKLARQMIPLTANSRNVLISSYPHFVDEGGTIGIVTVNERVRIELNLTVAKLKRADLSPDLIELSGRVIQ